MVNRPGTFAHSAWLRPIIFCLSLITHALPTSAAYQRSTLRPEIRSFSNQLLIRNTWNITIVEINRVQSASAEPYLLSRKYWEIRSVRHFDLIEDNVVRVKWILGSCFCVESMKDCRFASVGVRLSRDVRRWRGARRDDLREDRACLFAGALGQY